MTSQHFSGTRFRHLGLAFLLGLPMAFAAAQPIGHVEVMSVSPRMVAADENDVYDEVASGLNVVGVEEKVYLGAEPEYGMTLGGATWQLLGQPSGSIATLSDTTGTLVTLVPDVAGVYIVEMTPLDESSQPTEPVQQRIYAGVWVGAGVFNTEGMPDSTIPHCGNTCCHAESTDPRLNVLDEWLGSHHANTLQAHLNGERGDHTSESCLPCHTLGFKETADNRGFDDIAGDIGFDLGSIATLVQDAVANGNENFGQLPVDLQSHASVQCESCHGPGSQHMGGLLEPGHGIAGVDVSIKQCAQCHDSASGFQQGFYQWNASSHPITAELSEGHVAERDSCRVCHTGEGFVYGVAMDRPIPQLDTHDYHGITCSSCHDPHDSEHEHQLRLAGDTMLPSGQVFEDAGKGGLCMNCHNTRSTDGDATATGSFRGAHHGPQADMLLGVNMATFGLPVIDNSAHTTIVEDTCVACHMADGPGGGAGQTTPPQVGEHTYAMRDTLANSDPSDDIINAENACAVCHAGLTDTYDRTARGDYDGDGTTEGIQSEVTGLLDLLRTGLLALPGASLADDGTIGVVTADWNGWTDDQKRARYNFNMVIDDKSLGIHNTSFTVQMLQRSYFGAYGHTITDDFPNIDLRGPVQPSSIVTPTPTPTPIPTPTPVPTPAPEYLAVVNLQGVSPRDVAADQSGVYDEVASGLRAVGVGEKVYLQAEKIDDSVVSYQWSILTRPSGSTAGLSATTGEMVTFRPDKKGKYLIRLTPQTSGKAVIDVFDMQLYAAEWVGVGKIDANSTVEPRAPQCGTGFCHGGDSGNADLNVLEDWLKSKHASKLQRDMNGETVSHYAVSCLPCHTVGFNDHFQAVNNGFDDIATTLGFDLNEIPALVADAANNGNENFNQLPEAMQGHASIQCESCHGAGSLHPSNLTAADKGIDGADLDFEQCARCHDSASGYQQGFYQWNASSHPVTADLSGGHVAESDTCRTCHTGEGFVAVHGDGKPIPQLETEEYHGITCSACHDPHFSEEPHQLRASGDFTIPSGARPYGSGTGGTCFRCHNSRSSDGEATAQSSFRGAHYGTQADMLLGSTGVSFDLAFAPNSPHGATVEDSCAHCHMAETPDGGPGIIETPLVGGHSYAMRDTLGNDDPSDDIINVENACQQCHLTLDTYDYPAKGDYDGDGVTEGTQSEVAGLFELLRPGILDTMPGTSVGSNGKINITSGGFGQLTPDQKKALYNYNFVWLDGSYGVHNTSYAVQLLQRSYFGVYGVSILVDYPDIDLRGPVQDPTARSLRDQWAVH